MNIDVNPWLCVSVYPVYACVPGKRAAVAESRQKTDLQPAEGAARPTGETQDVQGESVARTRFFNAVFTHTHTHI